MRQQPNNDNKEKEKVELMTRKDVAEFLKVSCQKVDKMIKSGIIKSKKISRKCVRIKRSDVINYIDNL